MNDSKMLDAHWLRYTWLCKQRLTEPIGKKHCNKVMFDIRYYFCRHGGENIKDMTVGTFELKFDTNKGISYIQKVKD